MDDLVSDEDVNDIQIQIPIWITIVFACVVIPLIIICLMISKRLREI